MDQKTGQQFYMHSVSDFFNETFQYFVLPTSQLLHWAVIDQPYNAVNSIIAISCRVSQKIIFFLEDHVHATWTI